MNVGLSRAVARNDHDSFVLSAETAQASFRVFYVNPPVLARDGEDEVEPEAVLLVTVATVRLSTALLAVVAVARAALAARRGFVRNVLLKVPRRPGPAKAVLASTARRAFVLHRTVRFRDSRMVERRRMVLPCLVLVNVGLEHG